MNAPPGLHLTLTGRVQGVGFRPFVLRLAQRLGLRGEVANVGSGVEISAWGTPAALQAFQQALLDEAPPLAQPVLARAQPLPAPHEPPAGFCIRPSRAGDAAQAALSADLPPDLSLCADCQREIQDPANRRFRHAFINCTQCGPRYTVISGLPYDRAATSMAGFAMCPACRAEYADPASRRFHAEPIACPDCGPRLQFAASQSAAPREPDNKPPQQAAHDAAALAACVDALCGGLIVAVKGIGGYHLLCDARNAAAIERLRQRKCRPHKPLAVMFPWRGADGLAMLRQFLHPDTAEERALRDPARPIVLVRRRSGAQQAALPDALAPGLDNIGAFLPYSPLHLLLLDAFDGPLVATSGNLSGEPVLTDARQAQERIGSIADAFLHHNRPILRPADDSVLRVMAGAARPIRLGRGMAPLQGRLPQTVAQPLLEHGARQPLLAVGGESKVTLALAFEGRIVLSPHIGDLSSPRGRQVLAEVAADLQTLYGVRAERLVADHHPDYASTRWALAQGLPVTQVWHHHAHASALAGEHPHIARWLMLTWDGVGLGEDGTLWGGEALLGAPGRWQRVASWRPFNPPGGDRAAREPWRSAAALWWEAGMEPPSLPVPEHTLHLAHQMWRKRLHAPATSAVGRLFDAASACISGIACYSFEAQGPMLLEACASNCKSAALPPLALPMACDAQGVLRTDWQPLLPMLADQALPAQARAACFHHSLANAAVAQILQLHRQHRFEAAGLCGGVFQNKLLAQQVLSTLQQKGIKTLLPAHIPANDGGLAWGQVIEAASLP